MKRVVIVDHGAGNLRSVVRAFEAVNAAPMVSNQAQDIRNATHVVVPGQGAFADCMRRLDELGLVHPIMEHIASDKPYLGICLGMQILFEEGHEKGVHRGLGVFSGTCELIPAAPDVTVPHMGWNQIETLLGPVGSSSINETLLGEWFYFVHSYRVLPSDDAISTAVVRHGNESVVAAVESRKVLACQFHPEKSHDEGLNLLRRFLEWS